MTLATLPGTGANADAILTAGNSQATAVEQARAVAEVQAAVVVAQSCPRNVDRAIADMQDTCGRLALAERAFYAVKNRGEGRSVHLARELARVWGNVDHGVRELRRDDAAGVSEVLATAWEQQTNTRASRTFIVPHERMKLGKRVALTDLSDVYLNNQNIGARAVRECIFAVLPDWFVEQAAQTCQATLENGEGVSLPDRRARMVQAFDALSISQGQIETWLGKSRDSWSAKDVASAGVAYRSIQTGEADKDELFPPARVTAAEILGAHTSGGDVTPPVPGSAPDDVPSPPEPEPAPQQGPRWRAMQAGLSDMSFPDRAARIAYVSEVIGRPVESTNDLTYSDIGRVLVALDTQRPPADDSEPDPDAARDDALDFEGRE